MRMRKLALAGLLLAFIVTPVLGDDNFPPPWDRANPRATYQRWEFDTSLNPTPPNFMINPFGVAALTVTPAPGDDWRNLYDNRIGVWPLSGEILVDIPNAPDQPDWTKKVWIQLTWELEGTILPDITVNGVVGQEIETDILEVYQGHEWFHTTWLVNLPNNPPSETVRIAGDLMVDELVIDTICVPAPGAVMLGVIGIGMVGTYTRKRRLKHVAEQ